MHGHRPLCVPTPQISLFFLSLQNTFLTMYFCLSSQHPDALKFPLSTRQREELLPSSLSFSQCFGGGCINSLLKNICRYALIKLQVLFSQIWHWTGTTLGLTVQDQGREQQILDLIRSIYNFLFVGKAQSAEYTVIYFYFSLPFKIKALSQCPYRSCMSEHPPARWKQRELFGWRATWIIQDYLARDLVQIRKVIQGCACNFGAHFHNTLQSVFYF